MRPLWLCWALWALPLAGPGAALTEERILDSLLQQLHLSEVPIVDKAAVEGLVIPAHVRAQYVALLQRGHGARSRGTRFSQNFRGEARPPAAAWSMWGWGWWGVGGLSGVQGPRGCEGGPWLVRMAGLGPWSLSARRTPPLRARRSWTHCQRQGKNRELWGREAKRKGEAREDRCQGAFVLGDEAGLRRALP